MSSPAERAAATHAIAKLIEQKKAAGWYIGARSEDIRDMAQVAIEAAVQVRLRGD